MIPMILQQMILAQLKAGGWGTYASPFWIFFGFLFSTQTAYKIYIVLYTHWATVSICERCHAYNVIIATATTTAAAVKLGACS